MTNRQTNRGLGTLCSALAGVALTLVGASAAAEDVPAFYAQKTVKFIVGYAPGGGYDSYARMLQPYLAKAIGATVIVENQPGAGSLMALNKLYASEPTGL